MVFGPLLHSPNSSGLDNMMAGSAGSANGIGAANMAEMLSRFSTCSSASAARRTAREGKGEARERGSLRFGCHD